MTTERSLTLPSIRSAFDKQLLKTLRFVRPQMDVDIFPLHERGRVVTPLCAETLHIRRLHMEKDSVTPIHVHDEKEKLYVVIGEGQFTVIIWYGELFTLKQISSIEPTFLVQKGVSHALFCTDTPPGQDFAEIIVVSSSQNADDIAWESAAGELVKNEHLADQQA